MFWEKEIETASRDDLNALKLRKLQKTVECLYSEVPFYKDALTRAGLLPSDIKKLEDIAKFPFTTKEDLREYYPDGMLAVPQEKVVRLHTSSGTTGKPKAIFFSSADIRRAANNMARCLVMTGMTSSDILQNMMTYGLFTGAFMMHYGCEQLGAMVVPSGPGNTERQISLMQDFRTTSLHLTPSYALYLIDALAERGVDPKKDLALKRAYVGAEPYTEETRRKIESSLGIDVFNCYGLSEMNGPGVAFECEKKQGLHLWEDQYLLEIVDPETGLPLPEGARGEMVLTTLDREAMPILRYRVGDITDYTTECCECGRTHQRISRIFGRTDDMFIIRGVNIFPQQIERTLMAISGVGKNYRILLESYDVMTVQVELEKNVFDGSLEYVQDLKNRICEALRGDLGLRPKVEILEPGTLPVSEGKAERVVDQRTL